MARIVIVEEDGGLCSRLEKQLQALGHRVKRTDTLSGPVDYSLAIVDITVGGGKSLYTLLKLRVIGNIPVLVISNREPDIEAVAIELGADGVLEASLYRERLPELVTAILERTEDPKVEIEVDGLSLDTERRLVVMGNKQVRLSTTECALLEQLLLSAGSVSKRETLQSTTVGQCLEMFIQLLSRKLGRQIQPVGDEGFVFVL